MKLPAETRLEIATVLENFVEGRGGPRDWDAFLSERFEDQENRSNPERTRSP
jgi:hypothetical protein